MVSHNGVAVYVGSTDNLVRRVWEHKNEVVEAHTKDYYIHKLVYYESHDTREMARMRENRIKRWRRDWKNELIAKINPRWEDLYREICK